MRTRKTAAVVSMLVLGAVMIVTAPVTAGAPASNQAGSITRAELMGTAVPHLSQPARNLRRVRAPEVARTSPIPQMPLVPRDEGDETPTVGVQRTLPPRMPSVTSFAGQGFTSVRPPDPTGEVNGTYFVQAVNNASGASIAVYDKTTGILSSGPWPMAALWGAGQPCHDSPWGDPIVHYDQFADRWVMAQGAGTFIGPPYTFYYCVAVSQTSSPAGAYYTYDFDTGNRFTDYPKLAVWADAYYMTSNDFMDLNTYDGPSVWAFQRAAMLEGDAASYQRFDLEDTYYGLLPADVDGPSEPFMYNESVVSMDEATDQLYLWDTMVDWYDPGNSQLNGPTVYPVNPFTLHFCADERRCLGQPGTTVTLDSLARHIMFRLAYRNLGGTEMMAVSHNVDADMTKTKFRWYVFERNVGESTWNLTDQSTFGPDASNRWIPSVAIDGNGDLGLVYNVVNTTSTYPGSAISGRLYTDPPGSLGVGEAPAAPGLSSSTTGGGASRWGDYNHASADPTDACTFWYTAEHMGAASQWATSIGHFSFPECGTKDGSDVSLKVSGQYGKKGSTLLFHPKDKIKSKVTVDTGAPSQWAEWHAEVWDKTAATWIDDLSMGTNLNVTSGMGITLKASMLGKGKYRLSGYYPGDADSHAARSSYVMIKVMKP